MKFLCLISWKTYDVDDYQHTVRIKRSEIRELTTEEINEFIKNPPEYGSKPKIKIIKQITPIQTPNPQSVFNKVEGLLGQIISNSKRDYDKDGKRTITIRLDKLQKLIANGETPEVDNTVGQELIEDYILYAIRNSSKEAWPKDSIGEAKLLGYIMYIINQFKPVETTKEQPTIKNKCSCINPHYGFKTINICTDCNGIKDEEYFKNLG